MLALVTMFSAVHFDRTITTTALHAQTERLRALEKRVDRHQKIPRY